MTIAVVIEIRPGTPLATAAAEAIALAQQLGVPVKSSIKGVEVYATPTDTLQTIADRYNGLLTQRQALLDRAKARTRVPSE